MMSLLKRTYNSSQLIRSNFRQALKIIVNQQPSKTSYSTSILSTHSGFLFPKHINCLNIPTTTTLSLLPYQLIPNSSSTSSYSTSKNCWKCSTAQPAPTASPASSFPPFCSKCNVLQDVDTSVVDYFHLLMSSKTSTTDKKVPEAEAEGSKEKKTKVPYQIDVQMITNRAKELQKKLHPDLFTNKETKEQELSDKYSSFVNHALFTLQNPIERGLYLFKQQYGAEFDMESQLTMDTEFLGTVMELNEKLLELANQEDWTKFRNENDTQLRTLEKNLGNAFAKDDPTQIKLILSKMKYYDNLQGKLKEQQFKLGIVE